jgi:hypothetical protein
MPEPQIPVNAYRPVSPPSQPSGYTSPALSAADINMPDAAHYIRPNAYAAPPDANQSGIGSTSPSSHVPSIVPAPPQAAIPNSHDLAAPVPPESMQQAQPPPESNMQSGGSIPVAPVVRKPPDWRLALVRVVQLLAAIAVLGFAAGATPYSGEDSPFSGQTAVDLYYAVSGISCVVSLFLIGMMIYRWIKPGKGFSHFGLFITDVCMALIWGTNVITIIATKSCKPGDRNGWCDFFNTAIFFGVLAFVCFLGTTCFDVYNSCCSKRRAKLSEDFIGKRTQKA